MSRTVFLTIAALWLLIVPMRAHADTSTTMIAVGTSTVMPLSEIIAKGLPVVYIETVEGEEPTCDYVSAPPGCMSASIANATKVPGRLMMYRRIGGRDSVLYDSGDYEKDVSGMTIKLRGNKSAYDVKKPYKIKLQKKRDLLFGGVDSVYKDKEWLLLRDDYLTTLAGFKVNELLGMTWTPRHHFVNVVMNGSYRGTYLLCESVKRNPDCRLNVDKTCGFIFECDAYWWNEDVYVNSSKAPSYNYTFKYPDDEDITPEQLDYMQSLVTAYEASLTDGTYPELIDVTSFACWCLVQDVLGTKDAGGTNMFYTKYDTTAQSLIVMPLAWDFDMAERTAGEWSQSHTVHMAVLFNSANRAFVGEYAALWRKVRGTLVNDMSNYLFGFHPTAQGQGLEKSITLDEQVYGRSVSLLSQIIARRSWISSRRAWMDQAVEALNPLGDVNVDGHIDVTDVTILIQAVLDDRFDKVYAADVNGDGEVNITDVIQLINTVLAS